MKKTITNSRSMVTAALIVFSAMFFMTDAGLAQSTDQSSPTPITSNELTIPGPKKTNQQYYYSFTGGPGEVSITLNVKAKTYSTFVGIKVFDGDLNTLAYHNMSAATGSPGLASTKFDVGEKQTLILSFTSDSSLAECKIKFGGAVEVGSALPDMSSQSGSTPEATDSSSTTTETTAETETATQADNPTVVDPTSSGGLPKVGKNKAFTMSILDAVGQRFNIPANGKLRIEMKDGSVQEIDLSQVKKLLVKQ